MNPQSSGTAARVTWSGMYETQSETATRATVTYTLTCTLTYTIREG